MSISTAVGLLLLAVAINVLRGRIDRLEMLRQAEVS